MYFWNIRKLKQQLINEGLTEIQLFYYVLIYIALSALSLELLTYFPSTTEPNQWTYIESVINFLIPILGTIAAFHANGGSSGTKFPERYFSIMFVACNRFLVLLIALAILRVGCLAIANRLVISAMQSSSFFDSMIYSCIWYAALYFYIAKNVGDVAKTSSVQQA